MHLPLIDVVYRLLVAFVEIAVMTFAILSLRRATVLGRTDYTRWLKPFVIGDFLQFVLYLLSTFQYYIFGRGMEMAYVLAFADLIPLGIIIYGSVVMWQTLKGMQPDTQSISVTWPPAPQIQPPGNQQ